jgi:hypothetical protein
VCAALVGAALLIAAPSTAEAQSPTNGNLDIQFGPYYPRIDEEFDTDEGPFETTFGTDTRVMLQIDAVYYLWQGHGKLGIGPTFGYTRFNGDAEIRDGDGSNGGDGSDGGGDGSGGDGVNLEEETRFTVFPLGLIGTYRWDYPTTEWGIPLAARVEGGFDYYLWRVADENGDVVNEGDFSGAGGTPGFHATLRGELLLDWLDSKSAAQFDYSWGVNNTYFFGEYTFSRVRDFDGKGFRLGDNSWRLGLAFEF